MKKVFAVVSLFALGLSSAIGLNLVNNAKEAKEVDATPVLVPKTATITYEDDSITGGLNNSTYREHRYVADFNGTSVYIGGHNAVQSSAFALRGDVSIFGNIDPSFDAEQDWKDKIPNNATGAIPGAITEISVTVHNDNSVSRGLILYLGTSQILKTTLPEGLAFYGDSESGTGYTYDSETRTYTIPVDSSENYTYFAFNGRQASNYTGITSISVTYLGETEDPVVRLDRSSLTAYTGENTPLVAEYFNLLGTGVDWTQSSSDGGEVNISATNDPLLGQSVADITFLKAGTVTVTATDNNGTASASCVFTIDPSILAINSTLRITDSNYAVTNPLRFEGSGPQGEYDIYVHDTRTISGQLGLLDNSGYIYNETSFSVGIKMIKVKNVVEGKNYYVEFSDSEITNKDDGVEGTKFRLGSDEYWIPTIPSTHFRLNDGKNGNTLFKIDAIEVYEESLAAKAFAEMYLNAYTCNDNGASLPTLNDGYTYENMKALYNALDGDSQDRLVNATINHTDEYGTDVIKEYGQRYYLIVYNHGAAGYDFMDLVGAGSITPHGSERSILSNITNENTPIYIVSFIVVISVISISGLLISKRRKKDNV